MHDAAIHVEEGAPAPDFTLPDQDGAKVRLADQRGHVVVLYMYPKDDTPGCTKEACDFRDNLFGLKEAGAIVLGLSPDQAPSHRKFRDKYALPFTLLTDEGAQVASLYGAWKEKQMFGRKYMGIERSTFVIDREGIVRKVYRKVSVSGHAKKVLKEVQALVG